MPRCRCADCGLLAIENHSSHELREASWQCRQHGNGPAGYNPLLPVCIVSASNLNGEMKGTGDEPFLQVVQAERDCPKFYPWQQGFSPKDHQEMLHEQQLREWQAARDDKDREWRAQREEWTQRMENERKEKDRQWQREREKDRRGWEEKRDSSGRWFQVIILLVGAAIGAGATLAGGVISGWLPYHLEHPPDSGQKHLTTPAKP